MGTNSNIWDCEATVVFILNMWLFIKLHNENLKKTKLGFWGILGFFLKNLKKLQFLKPNSTALTWTLWITVQRGVLQTKNVGTLLT